MDCRCSALHRGRQMSDAVSGLHPARMPFADHRTRSSESDGHRGPRGIFREQDVTAQIARDDLVAQFGGRLKESRFRRIDVCGGTENVEHLRLFEIFRQFAEATEETKLRAADERLAE